MFYFPFLTLLSIWSIYYLDWNYFLELNQYGIAPRTLKGLRGIFFSPFLHGSLSHLWNNTLALIVLLPLMVYYYQKNWVKTILFGTLLSGFGTWAIAQHGIHIGASGVIYMLVAYMFFSGMLSKHYRLMAIALVVVVLYGSLVWYMFPNVEEGISWQGHLAGFLSGLLLSLLLDRPKYEPKYTFDWQQPDFDESQDDFISQFDANGNFNPQPKVYIDEKKYVFPLNQNNHRKLKMK